MHITLNFHVAVVRCLTSMSELNKSLLEAASMLNLEAIQKLLASGADATHIDDPDGVWGSKIEKKVPYIWLCGHALSSQTRLHHHTSNS